MTKAKNAPVKYVIGVVRFPPVADLSKFAGAIQNAISDQYPISSTSKMTEFGIQIDDKGVNVQQNEVSLWQFVNNDHDCAVIVNQGQVGLHTVAYENHEDFIHKLMDIVEIASKVEGNLLRRIEALGLRYVDLVEPLDGESLAEYLDTSVIPSDIGIDGLAVSEGVTVLGMKSEIGNVRVQCFLNPQTVLPTDLHSPLLLENGWNWERPKVDFVTIDTDHSTIYAPPVEIGTIDVRQHMYSLRKPISDIFKRIATHHAMDVWKLSQ